MYRRSLREKHLPFTACWWLDSSGDCVGNDNDNDEDDNNNRDYNYNSVQFPRSHYTYQFQTSWDLVRHISAARILRFFRLIELQQDYHICHNSRRILKQRKQYRMKHSNVQFVDMSVHYLEETEQSIITLSQPNATLIIFKIAFTSLKTQLTYCRRCLFCSITIYSIEGIYFRLCFLEYVLFPLHPYQFVLEFCTLSVGSCTFSVLNF